MEEQLMQIEPNVYLPCVKIKGHKPMIKSVIIDGETFTKEWLEEYEFDSKNDFQQRGDKFHGWRKYEYDFTILKHHNITLWDYEFIYSSIMDEICPTYIRKSDNNNLYRLYNYIFYDYTKPIKNVRTYKTRQPKITYSYKDTGQTIFDKNIITGLYPFSGLWRTSQINCYEALMEYSTIQVVMYNNLISIPLKHFIHLDIHLFPDDIKNDIRHGYIKDDFRWGSEHVTLPDKILHKKLSQKEINKIMSDILKKKINYKRKKQSYETSEF